MAAPRSRPYRFRSGAEARLRRARVRMAKRLAGARSLLARTQAAQAEGRAWADAETVAFLERSLVAAEAAEEAACRAEALGLGPEAVLEAAEAAGRASA